MPIINPVSPSLELVNRNQVQEALTQVKKEKPKKNLTELLDDNGLSVDDILRQIADVMVGGETSAVKMKAAEIGCKLHGLMETENIKQQPIVNIIIKDTRISDVNGINPICVPRS